MLDTSLTLTNEMIVLMQKLSSFISVSVPKMSIVHLRNLLPFLQPARGHNDLLPTNMDYKCVGVTGVVHMSTHRGKQSNTCDVSSIMIPSA